GHGHSDRFHRQGKHLSDLFSGSLSCHCYGTECIEKTLHDHGAQSRDRIFKSHRKANFTQIAQGLREGRFDLGIGSQIPPDPELEQIPLQYQRFCLLIPEKDDPKCYSSVKDLCDNPLICYRKDYPMYRQLTAMFDQMGIQPHIIHYAYSEGAIAHLVEQELGIACVAQTEGLENYKVKICYPEWLRGGRYIYLMRHRTRVLTQAAQQLQKRILNIEEEKEK
ncbi:MAG: LysR family transcriptional regulator substrate-binding protein, partial [Lachnospiraceae bacterium]|nr:LysR family transcriptional regulator substrate-binding protein [Lachnospiraceae bacterium]